MKIRLGVIERERARVKGTIVVAECVDCGARRDIAPGEVAAGDMPMCHKCGSLMIAVRAEIKR